ncbi:MAG: ATP-dependent DNA ligase [Nitrososphaerota archaeon]
MAASFSGLVELCKTLERTNSRLQKVRLISNYLQALSPEEGKIASYLLIGRISEEKSDSPLNVGWRLVKTAIESGPSLTLVTGPLTIQELWTIFRIISNIKGEGSREKKLAVLQSLFSRCSREELGWLLRIISGEMRHGVNIGLLLDVVSSLSGLERDKVRRLDMIIGDIGELVRLALTGELSKQFQLRIFSPLRPMLAEMCYDIQDAIHRHGGKIFIEPKYDGVRIQIHKQGNDIRLFTRRLSDVTESMPDIVDLLSSSINVHSAILDGEVVAVDASGKALPFQETMRRVTRERDIEEAVKTVPLRIWIFDALMINDEVIIDKPYVERRKMLEAIVKRDLLAPNLETDSKDLAEEFLRRAIEQGHEGIMAKHPLSPYIPGKRGASWLKIKPADSLDLVIIAAEWGHGRRSRWLSNYHLAVRDKDTGNYLMVGKTFKGLTDNEFELMTNRLISLKVSEHEWGVTVKPSIVVEVAYNEIQRSPHYESGYALRFARIIRIRDDKSPEEIDTYQRLKMLYQRQFEMKGRSSM